MAKVPKKRVLEWVIPGVDIPAIPRQPKPINEPKTRYETYRDQVDYDYNMDKL